MLSLAADAQHSQRRGSAERCAAEGIPRCRHQLARRVHASRRCMPIRDLCHTVLLAICMACSLESTLHNMHTGCQHSTTIARKKAEANTAARPCHAPHRNNILRVGPLLRVQSVTSPGFHLRSGDELPRRVAGVGCVVADQGARRTQQLPCVLQPDRLWRPQGRRHGCERPACLASHLPCRYVPHQLMGSQQL